jgi:3-oxoacyl-[acyl-carrier protein] reductase
MLMSVIARQCEYVSSPELAGARVLITGMTSQAGFDVARAFADHGARLVLQSPEDTPEMTELAAVLAENCSDIRVFNDPIVHDAEAMRLVQSAALGLGGLDAVVNLVSLNARAADGLETAEDVEALVAQTLRSPLRLAETAANRMRLTLTEGSILTVVQMGEGRGGRRAMLADVLRARLGELTRGLAMAWAEHGIRINAVGPPSSAAMLCASPGTVSDADLAALALQLASRKGRSVSGHVLDAEGAARRWC